MNGHVSYRRVYDEVSPSDGARVLVDRVWPRGIRKDALDLTEWLRDVAPSTELRQWYSHEPEKFAEFRSRYLAELKSRNVVSLWNISGKSPARTTWYC